MKKSKQVHHEWVTESLPEYTPKPGDLPSQVRKSLIDVIYDISPEETPFMNGGLCPGWDASDPRFWTTNRKLLVGAVICVCAIVVMLVW